MEIAVSIVICTRNRCDSLIETLASIGRCEIPADLPTELLVVDNGSTDRTREVVEAAGLSKLVVRYIFEPRAGQCHARNRGLAEGGGDIFVFTDDDVRVPPDWIERMCQPILNRTADAVAGGVAFPAHILQRMREVDLYKVRWWFASTDGMSPENPGRMVGANMAFSRRVLQRVPEFDVRLGPGALGFADETFFAYRLLEEGYRLIAAFDVAVEHHFDIERMNRANVLFTSAKMGRSDGYLSWHWRHTDMEWTLVDQMRLKLGLLKRRLLHPLDWWRGCTPSDWEIDRVFQLAWRDQFSRERRLPRRYAKMRRATPETVLG